MFERIKNLLRRKHDPKFDEPLVLDGKLMTPEKLKKLQDEWTKDMAGRQLLLPGDRYPDCEPKNATASGVRIPVVEVPTKDPFIKGWFTDTMDKKMKEGALQANGIRSVNSSSDNFAGISTIWGKEAEANTPMLTRMWFGHLRLHIFYRGDQDPDCHDHPWDFWTFPFHSYVEEVIYYPIEGPHMQLVRREVVRAWRLHFRKAEHTHRVLGRWRGDTFGPAPVPSYYRNDHRVVTLVWRSADKRKWGFWKLREGRLCWVPWREYIRGNGKNAPCE